MSSRPTSRQTSQDPHPQSSIHSGGGGFRSSVTHDGGFDHYGFGESSPLQRRSASMDCASQTKRFNEAVFDSQVESLEKESREFCE